ncbi:hypothetical protein ACFXGT_31655 [Streptomyces sp. NPDC059352]|uniref:hypothetical protein n=1 Tax=Streptomyces sp. NPDC059352 TaxID=3346810 RepID=UPI0036CC6DF1
MTWRSSSSLTGAEKENVRPGRPIPGIRMTGASRLWTSRVTELAGPGSMDR